MSGWVVRWWEGEGEGVGGGVNHNEKINNLPNKSLNSLVGHFNFGASSQSSVFYEKHTIKSKLGLVLGVLWEALGIILGPRHAWDSKKRPDDQNGSLAK